MRVLIIFILSFTLLFAKSDKVSHIPPTKSVFIDTSVSSCDATCMQQLLEDGEIFSFLSKYNPSMAELASMQSEFEYYQRVFRIYDDESASIKVALLVPQKSIRRYAISTVNSVLAYMLSKQNDFEIRVFNSMDETPESLTKTLAEVKKENFRYLIAPVTVDGAKTIIQNSDNLVIYIPTVHSSTLEQKSENIIFGGIDYDKQIESLLKYTNEKVAYFWDGSSISQSLNDSLKKRDIDIVYSKSINNSKVSFRRILKNNQKLQGASIFMNTPLVKTSLISSQLRVYDIEPYILLSTQINYNPMLLTLTQYEDRKNLFVANSIGHSSIGLQEMNSLFGHNIVYDWVNYSTSIGIEHFFTRYFVPTTPKSFAEEILENQVEYDISIIRPKRYKFEKELFKR